MIGPRIKSARRLKNMTLKELAESSGTSEGHMSKVENGKVEASLALLHRVTQTLGLNLDVFFDEQDAPERSVSRAGARPMLEIDMVRQGTGLSLERVIPCTPDHMLQCNIHIVEPGGSSDGQIDHVGEEMGFVLEGQIELLLDEEVFLLGVGDAFHFKSHRKHGYRNPGKARARILWANTPPTF
ncbi:cupin domain-containing protein [Roseovarius sp. S4756]|uniref:cupin domain-containing protein n=1 Tax=Roseovarius maritimus TaxID=3342637 RepID=UPI003729E5D0